MANSKITVESLNLHYGENHALKNVNMEIADHAITAFIGPSGCGKSTFLRCLNRMNDLVDGCRVEGKVILDGEDIYDKRVDTTLLRKRWVWYSNSQILFPCLSMTILPMVQDCMASRIKRNWMRSWSVPCRVPLSSKK